jgi:hypothetical protein
MVTLSSLDLKKWKGDRGHVQMLHMLVAKIQHNISKGKKRQWEYQVLTWFCMLLLK